MSKLFILALANSALILGAFAAVIVPNFDQLKPGDSLGGNYPAALRLIGNVDGKSYFAENVTRSGWVLAGAYCDNLGMSLATITTQAQANLLANANADFFNGTFWTGGRDAHQLRQFSWNKTDDEQPNAAFVRLDEHLDLYLTCVGYQSLPANSTGDPQSHLVSSSCIRAFGVICES